MKEKNWRKKKFNKNAQVLLYVVVERCSPASLGTILTHLAEVFRHTRHTGYRRYCEASAADMRDFARKYMGQLLPGKYMSSERGSGCLP